jgi:hypothetical protein
MEKIDQALVAAGLRQEYGVSDIEGKQSKPKILETALPEGQLNDRRGKGNS